MLLSRGVRIGILLLTVVAGIVAVAFVPPVAQDPAYHQFADTRRILNLPNFWNVVTNLAFVMVGIIGLAATRPAWPCDPSSSLGIAYRVFFIGLVLTGFGSAYYHFSPSTPTLFWDRLSMAISFMAFLALVLGDSVSPSLARRGLVPLLLVGTGSVVYWYATELRGAGDLRLYALVQYFPVLLIPITLILFGSRTFRRGPLWICLGLYALAKVAESLDAPVFDLTRVVSGHSIKHLLAAAGAYCASLAFREKPMRP